jgi:hypothetical protein
MTDEDLAAEFRELGNHSEDIVEVLRTMCARHDNFEGQLMVAARAALDGLELSMPSLNVVIGWLKGEVDDHKLRSLVELRPRAS